MNIARTDGVKDAFGEPALSNGEVAILYHIVKQLTGRQDITISYEIETDPRGLMAKQVYNSVNKTLAMQMESGCGGTMWCVFDILWLDTIKVGGVNFIVWGTVYNGDARIRKYSPLGFVMRDSLVNLLVNSRSRKDCKASLTQVLLNIFPDCRTHKNVARCYDLADYTLDSIGELPLSQPDNLLEIYDTVKESENDRT